MHHMCGFRLSTFPQVVVCLWTDGLDGGLHVSGNGINLERNVSIHHAGSLGR